MDLALLFQAIKLGSFILGIICLAKMHLADKIPGRLEHIFFTAVVIFLINDTINAVSLFMAIGN